MLNYSTSTRNAVKCCQSTIKSRSEDCM